MKKIILIALPILLIALIVYSLLTHKNEPPAPPEIVQNVFADSGYTWISLAWENSKGTEWCDITWNSGSARTKKDVFEINDLETDSLYTITITAGNDGGTATPFTLDVKTLGKMYAFWDKVIDYRDEFHLIPTGPVTYELYSLEDSSSIMTMDTVYHFILGKDSLFKSTKNPCGKVRCIDKAGNIGEWSEVGCADIE